MAALPMHCPCPPHASQRNELQGSGDLEAALQKMGLMKIESRKTTALRLAVRAASLAAGGNWELGAAQLAEPLGSSRCRHATERAQLHASVRTLFPLPAAPAALCRRRRAPTSTWR